MNCAMPILKVISQERKTQMAISLMISSPTLNIFIVSLTFTMFPFYLAAIKLGFSFFTLFFLIPLISKTFGEKLLTSSESIFNKYVINAYNKSVLPSPLFESWFSSLIQILKDNYLIFKFVLKTNVPLVFLGGFIGFMIIHSLDISSLQTEGSTLSLAIIGLLSLLIPLPVSFDITLTHVLYEEGMSIAFTSILLCNLGIISIYTFFIIWTNGLKRWAITLFCGVFFLSYLIGLLAPNLHEKFYINQNISALHATIVQEQQRISNQKLSTFSHEGQLRQARTLPRIKLPLKHPEIEIFHRSFLLTKDPFQQESFTKIEGASIGLIEGFQYAISDYPAPFWMGRGSGAGDFNKDGWPDIAFGTSSGIALYQNVNGHFKSMILSSKIKAFNVYSVAFVDLNNDSWLDLFFTTFTRGNFVILNTQSGSFANELISIPNNKGIITLSPAIADFDGNGYLDIFNGNIALGTVTGSWKLKGRGRENSLTYNQNLRFSESQFPGQHGETMSTLASDLNNDGKLDLYQAHDFIIPDQFHYDVHGFIEKNNKPNKLPIPYSPFFSRSADSGDLNNDGFLDLVLTGTNSLSLSAQTTRDELLQQRVIQDSNNNPCHLIEDLSAKKRCESVQETWKQLNNTNFFRPQISDCDSLISSQEKKQCIIALKLSAIISNKNQVDCNQDAFDQQIFEICKILKKKSISLSQDELEKISKIKQKDSAFIYIQEKKNQFIDINQINPESFEHPGGSTWNTKIADLDSDGFQDIINSEGAINSKKTGWNTFMHNQGNGSFKEAQWSKRLTDPFSLFSFVLIDYDFDGDLDLIGNSSAGPIQVYKNRTKHHSISFILQDYQGNRFGIGSKIYLKTAKGLQLREVKASGGYLSFDPMSIHFGLGESTSASELKIVWPDGESHVMPGTWKAGHQYEIRRLPNN
ncbi:MAG: FG-GAP-like repeat-containing protein [Oligoflexales bacterium]